MAVSLEHLIMMPKFWGSYLCFTNHREQVQHIGLSLTKCGTEEVYFCQKKAF